MSKKSKKKYDCDNQQAAANKKTKRHLIGKAIGLGVLGTATATTGVALGAVATWQYIKHGQQQRRSIGAYQDEIIAKPYVGKVHRDARTFTLTTEAKTYHVVDPFAIVDSVVKEQREPLTKAEQAATSPYYDCQVCVMAEISPKGRYGYLGHLDYQLTVTGRCDDVLN